MAKIDRRELIRTGLRGAGLLLLSKSFSASALPASGSSDSSVEILLTEPLGFISPNIYGHFVENLSGVIYDGIWVGKDSSVPNEDGIRMALLAEMRKIKPAVVRFPGGCFADSYDWRDGVGPAGKRPRRTNFWAETEAATAPDNHRYDSNQFGTNEFIHFCNLVGGQPYLAANLRSLPAESFYRWVEYCNSPAASTTLADARGASGHLQPFDVRFWGVGNEAWGCGGNLTPEEYAAEFRRYTTWVPRYGQELSFIGSGPNGDDWQWTRGFFEEILRKGKGQLRSVYGWALHHYAWNLSRGRTQDWDRGKGDALQFDIADWYELLREGDRMQSLIDGHWKIMGEFDPEHSVKLVVDEWGPWYRPGSEATPGDQFEQIPTMRDAVFSAMTLDIFNRNSEKIAMANCAQLINCLNCLYLAHEDKFCVTPVGHVFELYAAHQGGQGLRIVFSAPSVHYDRDGKTASFWGLNGSASLQDHKVILTIANPHVTETRETRITLHGGSIRSAHATILANSDIHAHNTFENKDAVSPRTQAAVVQDGVLTFACPPASITKLILELA